jgi:hypothetical protein
MSHVSACSPMGGVVGADIVWVDDTRLDLNEWLFDFIRLESLSSPNRHGSKLAAAWLLPFLVRTATSADTRPCRWPEVAPTQPSQVGIWTKLPV